MKSSARILVVEDEKIVALDIKNQLMKMGHPAPLLASTGEEAVRMVQEYRPEVVLMDIALSDGATDGMTDGIKAASLINAQSDVPIIYVTGQEDEATIQRVKDTEMYGYILKPIAFRELEIAIEFALHKHQMTRKLIEQRKWLITTIRGIGDGIITTDQGNRVVLMNPAAESLTGWSETEARGRSLSDVFNIQHRDLQESGAALVWGSAGPIGGQTLLLSRDGKETAIRSSVWELKSDDARPLGAVIVVKSISEEERMEWSRPTGGL